MNSAYQSVRVTCEAISPTDKALTKLGRQQDNDPKYSSKSPTEQLKNKPIKLQWSSQSPDLRELCMNEQLEYRVDQNRPTVM